MNESKELGQNSTNTFCEGKKNTRDEANVRETNFLYILILHLVSLHFEIERKQITSYLTPKAKTWDFFSRKLSSYLVQKRLFCMSSSGGVVLSRWEVGHRWIIMFLSDSGAFTSLPSRPHTPAIRCFFWPESSACNSVGETCHPNPPVYCLWEHLQHSGNWLLHTTLWNSRVPEFKWDENHVQVSLICTLLSSLCDRWRIHSHIWMYYRQLLHLFWRLYLHLHS